MVYQDFSLPKQPPSSFRIPPILDRLFAFVFDCVIWTPIIGFILAGIFRKLEMIRYIAPFSFESMVLFGVCLVFVGILHILLTTVFLYFWKATPGKYFFKMQVISLSGDLRFSQCFLRSVVWAFEAVFLFLPFLEVLGERWRRPIHDRAAGTLVVTLKKEGDLGPHSFETQFVRQFLLAASLTVMTWVIFVSGHFYQLAVKGEFKKSELESEEYLCVEVTDAIEEGEERIDKALALYLADEVSEQCLAAEADFALWNLDEGQKSWAYLAKGIISKSDKNQFEAYLEKACESDRGLACEIAKQQANPHKYKLPEESETALVLKVAQDFEKAHYFETERKFSEFSKKSGYETFSQAGLIKSFWAQNQVEKAQGAYQSVVHFFQPTAKIELAAWICHEQLDRQCSQEAIEACEDLKTALKPARSSIQEPFVALALIREKECRQTDQYRYSQFKELFQQRPDLLHYVNAISRSAPLDRERRAAILHDLAFRKQAVRPLFVRRMALQAWVADYLRSEKDFQEVALFLKDKKVKDLSWVKVYAKALPVMLQANAQKTIREIVDLPTEEIIENYNLKSYQTQAKNLLAQEKNNRLPASVQASEKPKDDSK